jgi:hypothetical protein
LVSLFLLSKKSKFHRPKLFRTLAAVRGITLFAIFTAYFSFCISPAISEPLKANIEFSESLDPLQAGLREGERMTLKAGAANTQKKITGWRRVPDWFAGTWHKERTTRYVEGRPVSYQTRADLITGYQKDAKGRVWQPTFTSVAKVETDDYVEWQMPQRKTVYENYSTKYVSFSLSTRVRVDKDSNQIMSSFQQEDLSVSTPQPDGTVKAIVECRVFNQDGRVKFEDTIEVIEEKLEDFNPIDEFNGFDYRQNFIHFLQSKGHPELIPPDRPKSILTATQKRILSNEASFNRLPTANNAHKFDEQE